MTRHFGSLDFAVTTFGLGGQASLQWTPEDVDPVAIIHQAFASGVNYFDTSNLYGPSQSNFGKAFQTLDLIPGTPTYNEQLRRSIFLTSKTHLRWAKGSRDLEGINLWTNGERGSKTVDDLKRSLSQMFGDGKGGYPQDAYLDLVLIHNVTHPNDAEAIFEGLYDTDPSMDVIGALAALRDYRDGSNLTGLNPKEEKLIRFIGFSGHHDPSVMVDIIQRDRDNLLEGMLVAINANDRLNFNMQHNVIPVAKARNMGVIGMKTFADGAMYSKPATWSQVPDHVVRTLGSPELPYQPLIQYSLTTPGVDTLIIGIGQVSEVPEQCQLTMNIEACQIARDGLSAEQREGIEAMARVVKDGRTNYFQLPDRGLTAPRNVRLAKVEGKESTVLIEWDTAFAGMYPIGRYEVGHGPTVLATVPHQPQVDKTPFSCEIRVRENTPPLVVRAFDEAGNSTTAAPIELNAG